MKSLLIVLTSILCLTTGKRHSSRTTKQLCTDDVTSDFAKNQQAFSEGLLQIVAKRKHNHFVLSPYSVWWTLAGLAEGAEPNYQEKIFESLNLPNELCLRKKYYQLMSELESMDDNVLFMRKRLLLLDKESNLNTTWADQVQSDGLLDVEKLAIKRNTEYAMARIREITSSEITKVEFKGNSVIVDSLDYDVLWSTAFEEALIEDQASFYNDAGKEIGTVNLLKMSKHFKMVKLSGVKVLEIPLGSKGQYQFIIMKKSGKKPINHMINLLTNRTILDTLDKTAMSTVPIEIAIPQFNLTTVMTDMRETLEELQIKSVWQDPRATALVSQPPALPSAYLQRVRVSVDVSGMDPNDELSETRPLSESWGPLASFRPFGFVDTLRSAFSGARFRADRPFLYGLVDARTKVFHLVGAFSKP